MSEKRFELDVRLYMPKLLIDNATNERYHLLLVNDIEEIVDLLNELAEENEQLKKECKVIRGLKDERNCKVKQGENVNLSDYLEVDEMKNITKINIVDFIDDLIHERINECDNDE